MSFPSTAEGITRYLRSKSVTTKEIYDVSVAALNGQYNIYFPNGHIFVLELIIDRWNDVKHTEFRKDAGIWKLWNLLWDMVSSEDHKKKLLKNLRIVTLVQLTFEDMEEGDEQLCELVYEMVKSSNSCMITAVSPEIALGLLGKVIDIVLSCEFKGLNNRKQAIISEVLTFTDLNNCTEVSKKVSNAYCSELLLPSLKYLNQVADNEFDSISKVLSEFMRRFLFESSRELTVALKNFTELHKSVLTSELIILLFTKCITEGYTDSKILESILKIFIDVDPPVCADLLATLNSHRKNVSQEFLESLFATVFEAKDWEIVKSIIEMDIEIGILKTKELMESMEASGSDSKICLWNSVVNCHVNAREFTNLLNIWKEYCGKNTSSIFLTDQKMTDVISKSVPVLSTTQTRTIITDLVDAIVSENDVYSVRILQVIVAGLKMLSYTQSLEYRIYISKLFELEGLDAPEFWQLKYHILELYDDLLPVMKFNSDEVTRLITSEKKNHSSELFFTLFKFYELQSFEISPVIDEFMLFVDKLDSNDISSVLQTLFTRWSTLMNSSFGNDNISRLVKKLLQNHIEILPVLFDEEDFFEESNIVHTIVSQLTDDLDSAINLHYLLEVPIQCLNKNVRLTILDSVIEKEVLKQVDVDLVCHVLKNPTSRSKIETDCQAMLSFVGNQFFQFSLVNPVITTVWESLLLQKNDSKLAHSINTLLELIESGLSQTFNYETYSLVHLVLESSYESALPLTELKTKYIQYLIYNIKHHTGDMKSLAWLLKVLFVQATKSQSKVIIPPLFSNDIPLPADTEVQSAYFMVSTLTYNDKLEYLLAQYLILRERGVSKDMLLDAIKSIVSRKIVEIDEDYNTAFQVICDTIPAVSAKNSGAVLEVFQLFTQFVTKENTIGKHIFVRSISNLLTNYSQSVIETKDILSFVAFLNDLLVAKPFLFTQYCCEMLFPLVSTILLENTTYTSCSKNGANVENGEHSCGDDIILICTRMLSSLLLFHRYKLSNRTHLVNVVICQLLDILSDAKLHALSVESAKGISRFICNYCEPSNVKGNKQSTLSSAISNVKRSLRKHLPVILLQFIKLSISKPFPMTLKKELMLAVYAIFDLLSQTEMNLINANLDNNGRSYFKTLHADYKKSGKWHDD
ncbi:unnamed protein product [Kluyveromyces dobzhanskii CBS 2104]|uniref:WGS project CCBQ000000000 data, contig 00006 n=1 Tax=Kluyveromyces dobzhanskii CBS 2104 TaxID=1427455 RepID=A0A0A8LA45_9SACH|nr:unnamed protein product [Kluyveromyces dobzhanskii CBS 2104]